MTEAYILDAPARQALLYEALAIAAQSANAVLRASSGERSQKYASSEHILIKITESIKDLGLAIVPTSSDIEMKGTYRVKVKGYEGNPDTFYDQSLFVLKRGFSIFHKGGGELHGLTMTWPLDIHQGKSPDKACGSAETMAIAYFLRSAFLLPRLQKDDMDYVTRRDADEEPAAPVGAPAVGMLSPGAERVIETINSVPLDEMETRLSSLVDKWNARGENDEPWRATRLTDADFAAIMDAAEVRRDHRVADPAGDS